MDYVKWLNVKFFKMDISFVDDFVDLVGKDECCIIHDLLTKYEVTTLSSGSNDVKKIIERNDGRDGLDYKIRQLADRNIYVLHPTFFKKF